MSRDCKNCKHYVVSDTKLNYEQNGCGTYTQEIYSCEKWECEFEPTTKNDLGVDLISRADARKAIIDHQYSDSFCEEHNIDHSINIGMALIALSDLPSVTPQLSVPEVTALAEWTEKLTKASEDAYNKGYAED